MNKSKIVIFAQTQGDSNITEITLNADVSLTELSKALVDAGLSLLPEHLIFVNEDNEHLQDSETSPLLKLKHGNRIHVVLCRRIKTTVQYLDKGIEWEFAPGTRVRVVKAWAIREFHLDEKDGAEHVLQISNSTKRPPGDVPIHELIKDQHCALRFDLVPEKRVEG